LSVFSLYTTDLSLYLCHVFSPSRPQTRCCCNLQSEVYIINGEISYSTGKYLYLCSGKILTNFDARDFFDIGIKIAEDYASEAGYRTAIGRAYYACHLTNSKVDHSELWRVLRKNGNEAIAAILAILYRMREHSDYHMENVPGCNVSIVKPKRMMPLW
jgi:hypothetical protein